MDTRALAATRVLDVDGRPVRLADQWKTGPAVVVWLRHYGCVYCAELARDIMAVTERIANAGAILVFVGNGGPRHASAFQRRFAPGASVFTDPALESYRAIGARRGIMRTLGPQTWGHALRAFRRGNRQTLVKGHAFQQGGVLIVGPGTHIWYAYVSASAGDHPPVSAVLEALESRSSRERAAALGG